MLDETSRRWVKGAVLEKFLRYVKIDTQSDEGSSASPSTQRQFDLARLLGDELRGLGAYGAEVDSRCYVTAALPETADPPCPIIGLIAHLDTSPEVSGKNVTPRILENYGGGDIVLAPERSVVIRESENPDLASARGHTIVTAGGETLLGADDKAGVAAIMTAAEYLTLHSEIRHGVVKIAFTPDEEVGRGVSHLDVDKFGADFAYTVDGGFTGELNDETFSADAALVTITGRDMHPGSAKNRMVNSIRIVADLINRLPREMAPETTEGKEGYIHPHGCSGKVGCSILKMLLREFSEEGLDRQRELLETAIADLCAAYPEARFDLTVSPTYRNMKPALLKHPEVLGRLERAVMKAGVTPVWKPIRGGTDGAALTARGLPTPNIFTGGCNFHSLTEWLDVDGLAKSVETIINVVTVE